MNGHHTTLRFGSYNLLKYHRGGDQNRLDAIHSVIRQMDVDVLALQEVGPSDDPPEKVVEVLADDVGLTSFVPSVSESEKERVVLLLAIGPRMNSLRGV